MFACFFETNFPNIPFLKPRLLSFLIVWFFILLFLVLFSWLHVSAFLFLMLVLFLVSFILLLSFFCLVSCFAFTDYEKNTVFLALLVFFLKLSWLKGSFMFFISFNVFVLVCLSLFLVLSVCNLKHLKLHCFVICVVCFLPFVNKTKWFSGLHLVVLFPFLVVLCFLFFIFHSFQKKDPQKTGHGKNPKNQKCRKKDRTKNQLAQLCSQIVFLIFGGGLQKCDFLLNPPPTIKIGVWAYFWERKKRPNNVNKLVELNICPRLSWKNLSNYVVQHNWTDFQLNKMCVCVFLSFFYIKIAFYLQKEEYFWKIKKEEILDRLSAQKKGLFSDRFSALQRIFMCSVASLRIIHEFLRFPE